LTAKHRGRGRQKLNSSEKEWWFLKVIKSSALSFDLFINLSLLLLTWEE
jgi:hypothetical protein